MLQKMMTELIFFLFCTSENTYQYIQVLKCDVTTKTFLEFLNFITFVKKYSRKYELWWKFDENWAKAGWDMSHFLLFLHAFMKVWTHASLLRRRLFQIF